MFQWNNGQGNVFRMLASPALHFLRPFGYSIKPKPPNCRSSPYLKRCFFRSSPYLGIFIGLFSSYVRPIGLLYFTPSMAIGRMQTFCVFI